MLERIGLGRTRFTVPGLSLDGKGQVAGRQMVVRFTALDRLVSFLRLWSRDQSLDDVQPDLRILHARVAGGARDALVKVGLASGLVGDSMARAARLAGGQCFTGSGQHFVQFRDQRAPLGYDVAVLQGVPPGVDFVIYGGEQTWAYAIEGEIALDRFLLQLDLQRDQGASLMPAVETVFLTVRRGLGPLVIEYLHRARAQHPAFQVSAAVCEANGEGTFRREPTFWILRLTAVPARLLGLLSRTPGLTLFVPVSDNVAIAAGYRHPIHLGACRQAFPPERLFLFSPAPHGVTVVDPAPVWSSISELTRLGGKVLTASEMPPANRTRPVDAAALVVPLRLEAAPVATARASATLVPWSQVLWLRTLCYALPASALRGYRLAILARGVLVMAPDVLVGLPFGLLMYAPGPGLLAPLGYEIRPRVSPIELAASAGATAGAVVVFPGPDESPFRIPAESIEPLQARALADARLPQLPVESSVALGGWSPPDAIEIENQPLGPMPLWSLRR
jgi:hypothetical protein